MLLIGRAPSTEAAALVVATLIVVMALSLAVLLASVRVVELLGITGTNVVSRVLGILTAALAVQLVLDGLVEAAVLGDILAERYEPIRIGNIGGLL